MGPEADSEDAAGVLADSEDAAGVLEEPEVTLDAAAEALVADSFVSC